MAVPPARSVNPASRGECPLAPELAIRLRENRELLVERWLERIAARVNIDRNEVFPTQELLDHVPLLIDGIAHYVEDPADEITADMPVVAKAMELGGLRHEQGFDTHQILKEYEILGGVLFDFVAHEAETIDQPCSRAELLICAHRIFRSLAVIQQHTTMHFLRLADHEVKEREDRLHAFNRMVSHELKNRIGAARAASDMLREQWVSDDRERRDGFVDMVSVNLDRVQTLLADLIALSRATTDGTITEGRNVLLPEAAAEARRQLRDFAEERHVTIDLADLPEVEVPAAVVELVLNNFLSNAVKYRDPARPDPWVRVDGELVEGRLVVRVQDNGMGVPPDAREKLFERFFRAHATVTGEEGSGLGLSIVRETIEPLGGKVWAEFPDVGSTFIFSLPMDAAAQRPEKAPRLRSSDGAGRRQSDRA